jgi:lipopolysaccharide/colanic/teichoic acid biosynthesis glycosyltransferase
MPPAPEREPASHTPRGYAVAKRAVDVLGAGVALVVLSPVFLLVALLVKATSRGPVFFRQQRAGLGRRPFTMMKFRSMCLDAEQRRGELRRHNEMGGPAFKMRDDPRVTPLGRILRRTSLDELPQLLNVLRGQMSLVGPRPLPVEEDAHLPPEFQRRHDVLPGLTGRWQVSGRNDLPPQRMLELDLEYVERRSFWLDLRILLATIPAILTGRGAR